MPNAQQRSARNVANAGGLDHDRARSAACETAVPFDDAVRDKTVVRRAPGNHGRDPGALRQLQAADPDPREEQRLRRLLLRWNATMGGFERYALRGTPHALPCDLTSADTLSINILEVNNQPAGAGPSRRVDWSGMRR